MNVRAHASTDNASAKAGERAIASLDLILIVVPLITSVNAPAGRGAIAFKPLNVASNISGRVEFKSHVIQKKIWSGVFPDE
jgi:hypothetical protein